MGPYYILGLPQGKTFFSLGAMNARPVTPAGRQIFKHLLASGLNLATTSRRVGFWIEGLLEQLGPKSTDRLVRLLVRRAGSARRPEAWFNWATQRPWTGLVSDEEIRFVHRGHPPKARQAEDCGLEALGELVWDAIPA